jgi:hypothetical protein
MDGKNENERNKKESLIGPVHSLQALFFKPR